jgi:hypothetical protein
VVAKPIFIYLCISLLISQMETTIEANSKTKTEILRYSTASRKLLGEKGAEFVSSLVDDLANAFPYMGIEAQIQSNKSLNGKYSSYVANVTSASGRLAGKILFLSADNAMGPILEAELEYHPTPFSQTSGERDGLHWLVKSGIHGMKAWMPFLSKATLQEQPPEHYSMN